MIDAIERLEKEGKQVSIIMPTKEGHDLNDVLVFSGKKALKTIIANEMSSVEIKCLHDKQVSNYLRENKQVSFAKIPEEPSLKSIEKYINLDEVRQFMKQDDASNRVHPYKQLEREL